MYFCGANLQCCATAAVLLQCRLAVCDVIWVLYFQREMGEEGPKVLSNFSLTTRGCYLIIHMVNIMCICVSQVQY